MKTMMNTTTKSFLLLTALFLTIACSSDDDGPSVGNENQLVLTTAATKVGKGQEVTFEVTAGGQALSDAEILIDGSVISGYSHIFNYTGTYEAIAQKEGFLDSEPLSLEVLEVQTDVYVAGYENNGANYVAKYWKNGTPVNLTNGSTYAVANSIFVANGDVYVAGIEKNAQNTKVAKYWKNGIPVNLTDGTQFASANSVFVSNGDVYVAGGDNGAKYWKNGLAIALTNGTSAYASSIFVSNEDVYVAGGGENSSGTEFAKYWKNDMWGNLNDGLNDADANSIFVYNGDAYIAGHEYSGVKTVAKYWHLPAGEAGNGVPVSLTDGSHHAVANSIFVSNGKVYVAGFESNGANDVAKYWINGTPVSLTDGSNDARALSIFVSDGNVYVAGSEESNGTPTAKYWKNGTPISLTDGTKNASATSIYVVETLVE